MHDETEVSKETLEFVNRARTLLDQVKFYDYVFQIHIHNGRTIQLFADYPEQDTYTGKWEAQRTRRWNLTPFDTDGEIVQTAFKLCITSMEHRTREAFQYKGARIFGPHFDVEDLVKLCRTRENAGARNFSPPGGSKSTDTNEEIQDDLRAQQARAKAKPTDSDRLNLLVDWWFGIRKFKGDHGQALSPQELIDLIDQTLEQQS